MTERLQSQVSAKHTGCSADSLCNFRTPTPSRLVREQDIGMIQTPVELEWWHAGDLWFGMGLYIYTRWA